MSGKRSTLVFFRNDDVNHLEPGLAEVTQLVVEQGAAIAHAVEPANLDEDARAWLLGWTPRGVEVMQHGYAHTCHELGEFGGGRPAADQRADLEAGLRIMRASFGAAFLPAMSFPFGHYNEHTVPLLDELGYTILSSHVRHQFKRRLFYALGRGLRRGRWLGRHVSHHMRRYPGTNLYEISVGMSPIRRYLRDGEASCEFYETDDLRRIFRECRTQSPVVGIVLHHRFHATDERLARLHALLRMLRDEPGVEFAGIGEIHRRFAGGPGGRP